MTKKKRAEQLTDKEALKRLFPKAIRDEVERVAAESDARAEAREKKAAEKAKSKEENADS